MTATRPHSVAPASTMLSTRATQLTTDTPYYPAKTPARTTKNRNENAHQTTAKRVGKALQHTPFQPKTAHVQLVTRPPKPLADKTPFTNRVLNIYNTPAPDTHPLKPPTTQLKAPTPNPDSARASSTRKHPRVPKSLNFHTPANSGNYWDVSDDVIVVPEMDETKEEEDVLDLNDEIEYMPPNTLNLEYQPPIDFEIPLDYKLLGKAALYNLYSYPQEGFSPPGYDFHIEDDKEFMNWDGYQLSLPLLDDDDASSKRVVQPIRKPSSRGVGSRPATSASIRQPITAKPIPRTTAAKPVRPPSTITRKPPITKPPSRPGTKIPSRPPTSINTTRPTTTPSTTITSKIVTRPRSAAAVPKVGSSTRPDTSSSVKRPATSASVKRPTEVDKPVVTRKGVGARTIVPAPPSVKTRPRTDNGTTVKPSVVTKTTTVKAGPVPKGVGAKTVGGRVVKSEAGGLAVVKGVYEEEQGEENKEKEKEREEMKEAVDDSIDALVASDQAQAGVDTLLQGDLGTFILELDDFEGLTI